MIRLSRPRRVPLVERDPAREPAGTLLPAGSPSAVAVMTRPAGPGASGAGVPGPGPAGAGIPHAWSVSPPAGAPVAAPPRALSAPPPAGPPRPGARSGRPVANGGPPTQQPFYVHSTAMSLLAVLLLCFAVDVLIVGHVRHARDQSIAYSRLRSDLANGTTPVSQVDDGGHLWPLGTPVALLEIPQIGVHEVVFEGTTSGVLLSGPGHRRDSPLPGQVGNSVLLGRHAAFGAPFADIDQLTPGMIFWVTTGQGKQAFRVTGIRGPKAGVAIGIEPGQSRLTLVTAAGPGYLPDGVLRVDAVLAGTPKAGGPSRLFSADLPVSERANRPDPEALYGLVGAITLLLVVAALATWARWRWGLWQVWVAGIPVIGAIGVAVSEYVVRLLPNLL